jgi:hypothetical protein
MIYKQFFPDLVGNWAKVNLNDQAIKTNQELSTPVQQVEWLERLHRSLNVDFSYGGYLENRSEALKGQYHSTVGPDHFWHLGIDINVPAKTPVSMPSRGILMHSEMDKDYDGGWGGKLIFRVDDFYLILGHLDEIVTENKEYQKGEIVAVVADYPTNGNWFPHLHVQCCKTFNPNVDGYSHYYPGIKEDFPDPELKLAIYL